MVDNMLAVLDVGKCTFLVLLHFSRASYSLVIPLLLSKMSYYEFDFETIQWFDSYQLGRAQVTEMRMGNGAIGIPLFAL